MNDPIIRYFLDTMGGIIPDETPVEPYRDKNLNDWRVSGAYNCVNSKSKSFTVKVNQREYAAVLFSECEHLLNHAIEHRAHIINALSSGKEPSPSWLFVSLYYMALFIGLAWTRVANQGIVYLDKEAVSIYVQDNDKNVFGGAL